MTTYGPDSIKNIVLFILAVIVILIAWWCIFAFIRAILLFIFSQWKEDKIKKAWNSIRYMIMWLFLSVILLFIFPMIFKWMKLDNYDDYNAKNIFNKAWQILNYIFNLKDLIKESQEQNQYRWQFYYDTDYSNWFTSDYTL